MAVDAQMMRKDLFDLITMFGPANAGGPPQANTNPGSRAPQQNAQLPPPGSPAPQDPEATGSIQPQGVRALPPGTPIEPNVVKNPMTPQGGSPQQGPIELLPGDADPNLLPPEIRDSWMFRYEQARRAAAYKQAEEEARWANVVGGVGNIAQILSGQRPTYQQAAAHAKEPGAMDVGTLYGWKKDYDKAQQDAAAQAKYQAVIAGLKRAHPEYTPEDIDAAAQNPAEIAKLGFNATDAKAIADAAQARLSAVKTSQELAPAASDQVIKDIAKQTGRSEEVIRSLSPQDRMKLVRETAQAEAQSGTGERIKIAGEDIKNAKASNSALERTLVRNNAARQAIESGSGVTGGGYTETEIEGKAREIAAKFGIDRGAVANDRVVMALLSQSAIDMSQDMKGSLSDRDMKLLQKASAGDPNLSADEKSRIIALNDLGTRRQIDKNNDTLVRAGQRINDDRSGEVSKPNPMTHAELREIDPAIAREIIRNPENGRRLAEFQYGKSVADELVGRTEEIITSRLMEQRPTNSKLSSQASQGRTQLNADADTYLRGATVDDIVANRDRIIQQLNAMDPNQNGAATYELILDAKRAGRYGAKKT